MPIRSRSQNKTQDNVLIVGKGGEGVVLAGELLGLAATFDGKFASQRSNYGPSQRGEAIFTEVIVSKIPIQYTFIEVPTYFISLSQQGFEANYHRVKDNKNATLFIDSTHKYSLRGLEKQLDVVNLKARKVAMENGMPLIGNIILLTSYVKFTQIITKESLKMAILERISKHAIKQNLKAFDLGWKLKQV